MAYRLMGRLHAAALGAGRREAGQGTVEYVGLLLLIAVIIGAVVAASTKVGNDGIAKAIVRKMTETIGGMHLPKTGG